ncbi:PAS domain S-box-containing protein [Rhodoligotrophos appendicifer]|uniref:hybrid sensor histidine kinase/response regulator n=1 Tax=Rhodoligotrophos appendicifer TaxID=987056 RepID=UPI001187204C|nr:PAS domain S-box protein [Rhodoligotrophos appendicifer]
MTPAIADHASVIADAARLLRSDRDWSRHIDQIFARLGETLSLSRVYLFQVHDIGASGLGQTCLFDWAAPGLLPLTEDSRNIDEQISENDETMLDWAERRRRGELISGHTRDLTGYLRQDFEHQQIKSFMSFPIWANGHWWGHIGFDDCERERDWSAADVSVLKTIAYLLGDAIELSSSSLVMSEATRVAMMRAALDGIVIVDEGGCILDFSPAAEAIFGFQRAEVQGKLLTETLLPPTDDGSDQGLREYIGEDSGILGRRVEIMAKSADGRLIPIELTVTEIKVENRRLFAAYLRDLTERKQAEAEVARQREALHQSEKMTALGSLLAGVAHELNNPLSVVVGRAIMLEEDATDPVQRERLRKLREAAERCAKVSKTFLIMARQTPAARKLISLNDAIQSALDLVSYSLRSSGVEIQQILDPRLPPVLADFDQMVQVFVNLFVNADQAMQLVDGERRLTIETLADPQNGLAVCLVGDTGPGIAADVAPRIFEPFFTTKPVGLGTGLGLAVSFGMVTAHGGTLSIVPERARGAQFKLALPSQARSEILSESASTSPVSSTHLKILVVDDEPEVASLLEDILLREGHSVDHALNGREAMSLLADKTYDALFCDLRMPHMDGHALRRWIAENRPHYLDRMAFVTGDLLGVGNTGTIDGCPVIEKPFHTKAVSAFVQSISVKHATPGQQAH